MFFNMQLNRVNKMKYLLFMLPIYFFSCKHGGDTAPTEGETPSLQQIYAYNTVIEEPSGITYKASDNSFLVVSDASSTVYKIDSTGTVLGAIKTDGKNYEGISLSSAEDTIYIAEETKRQIAKFTAAGKRIASFSVDVAAGDSHSLEGICAGADNKLYILNEKEPCMLLEYTGAKETMRKEITFSSDLSDIFYEKETGYLWIVSDESKAVFKLTTGGILIKKYSISFDKGEGITIANKKIYIVNDSNGKLYVFKRPDD